MNNSYLRGLVAAVLWLMCQAFAVADSYPEPPPVELFAAHAKYQNMMISPDGKHLAFTFEEKDNEVKLAIATTDLKKITAVFGFGENYHIGNHFWANDERLVMRVWKNTGFLDGRRQNSKVFAADFNGGYRRELFPQGTSSYRVIDRLRSEPKYILVGKYNFRDEGQVKLHKINVKNGKADYIGGLPGAVTGSEIIDIAVDTNGNIRIAIELNRGKKEYDDSDDITSFHYKSEDGVWDKFNVKQARRPARYFKLGFNQDNSRYYFTSNYDMAINDTLGVFVFDFETASISEVFRHPDVDIQGGIYGPDGEVLGVRFEPGYPEKHYFDETNPRVKLLKSLAASFPGQDVSINSYTDEGEMAVVTVRSDRNPGEFFLYHDGQLKYLASTFPQVKPEQMGRTEAFTLSARDGVKLYGFITLPPGREATNLPMVVHPHGGPHGPYDRWGYNPLVQLLASRGYAVLQVNFRGSGGYGTDFEELGYMQWGRKMQDDITDATLWAVNQGIADIDRICISGGSFGGYATLQGVVREPDLYQCGIGIAGVYSLPMMRKRGDYRQNPQASNVYFDEVMGRDKAILEANSPAYNVDKIKAALFIIHGSNDVRVPFRQAKFLRDQLDAINKPYEWMVRKEGHGFTQESNRIDQYNEMLRFFDQHVGAEKVTMN